MAIGPDGPLAASEPPPLNFDSPLASPVTQGASGKKCVAINMAAPEESFLEKNLKGPKLSLEEREKKSLDSLREVLFDMSLPCMIDRTATPRTGLENQVTVVTLTEPENRMSVCLEGGKQCPGNVLMCINPAWLERRPIPAGTKPEPPKGATHQLFVHKAIWFDGTGQGYLDMFAPPRRVTYFSNFFTLPGSEGERDDGVALEAGLDCPMSSSSELEKVVNDKLLTRLLLSKGQVSAPACVAFTYKSSRQYDCTGVPGTYAVHSLVTRGKSEHEALFRREVERLVARLTREKVVVKPSGPMWMGSNGVSFWKKNDIDGIVGAMESLLQRLWDGDAILVEEFLPTLAGSTVKLGQDVMSPTHGMHSAGTTTGNVPTTPFDQPQAAAKLIESMDDESMTSNWNDGISSSPRKDQRKLGFRLRVMVARAPWGEPVVTKMLAGVGIADNPINGSNSLPVSFDAVMEQWGIVLPERKKRMTDAIQNEAVKVMKAIIEHEKTMAAEEKGSRGAQTDLIGIDFVLTPTYEGIMPMVIEVNDHDCSLQAQILECMIPETRFESIRWWVANMVSRSETYLMQGRTVLVVGAGGYSKRWVWEGSRGLGVNTILVEESEKHFARDLATTFIVFPDLSNHEKDQEHAEQIVAMLKERKIEVDGCLTFWEDCGPLAGILSHLLGTRGNTYEAQCLAKSKFATQDALMRDNKEYNHKPTTSFFASKTFRINTEEELSTAWDQMNGAPCVLKLEYGSSACGVIMVQTWEDCLERFRSIRAELASEKDHGGVGLGFGSSLVLMEFIEGSEHDVDLVMFDGQTIASFVTDNGPTRMPYCSETAAAMPSRLHRDKQRMMCAAASQCCQTLGLRNGVFNVEFKVTGMGPKLIEINARQGGFYIQDWTKRVWGIDLLKANLLISMGLRPTLFVAPTPRVNLVGRMIYASINGETMKTTTTIERLHELHESGTIILNQFEATLPHVEEFEEPFASVGIAAPTKALAKAELKATWKILGFEANDPKPTDWYLKTL